jgi:hypothetical protein
VSLFLFLGGLRNGERRARIIMVELVNGLVEGLKVILRAFYCKDKGEREWRNATPCHI